MKSDKLLEAIDKIDDLFIEEAAKYGEENFSDFDESDPENEKKKSVYYIFPVAAACVTLCLAVNHFTDLKNPEKPEIDNNVTVQTTEQTTVASDSDVIKSESVTTTFQEYDISENTENTISVTTTEDISSGITKVTVTADILTVPSSAATVSQHFSEITPAASTVVTSSEKNVTTEKSTSKITSETSKVSTVSATNITPESQSSQSLTSQSETAPISESSSSQTLEKPEETMPPPESSSSQISQEIMPNDNLGDFDGNGIIDITDLSELSLAIIGDSKIDESTKRRIDIDCDGEITIADLARLKQYVSNQITSLR